MMETPASHLARLRTTWGSRYRIDKNEAGGTQVYTARNRETGKKITAASLPVLEGHLIATGELGSR